MFWTKFKSLTGQEYVAVVHTSYTPADSAFIIAVAQHPEALSYARNRVWIAPADAIDGLTPPVPLTSTKGTLTALGTVGAQAKQVFLQRDELINLIMVALMTCRHLFVLGERGTAKSALARYFANAIVPDPANPVKPHATVMMASDISDAALYGGIDPIRYRNNGEWAIKRDFLANCWFGVIEEIWKGAGDSLQKLLTFLADGELPQTDELAPMLMVMAISNELPASDDLTPLYDRFALRMAVKPLPQNQVFALMSSAGKRALPPQVLRAGELLLFAGIIEQMGATLGELLAAGQMPDVADAIGRVLNLATTQQGENAVSNRMYAEALGAPIVAHALLNGRVMPDVTDVGILRYVVTIDPTNETLLGDILAATDAVSGGILSAQAMLEALKADVARLQPTDTESIGVISKDFSRLHKGIKHLKKTAPNHPEVAALLAAYREWHDRFTDVQAADMPDTMFG